MRPPTHAITTTSPPAHSLRHDAHVHREISSSGCCVVNWHCTKQHQKHPAASQITRNYCTQRKLYKTLTQLQVEKNSNGSVLSSRSKIRPTRITLHAITELEDHPRAKELVATPSHRRGSNLNLGYSRRQTSSAIADSIRFAQPRTQTV